MWVGRQSEGNQNIIDLSMKNKVLDSALSDNLKLRDEDMGG